MLSQTDVSIRFGFIPLIIYLALLFFEPQQFYPVLEKIHITRVSGLMVLCWALISSPSEVKRNILKSGIFKLFCLFFFWCTLSLIVVEQIPVSENRTYNELLKVTVLFLMVALLVRSPADFVRLCWILIIFTTIDAVVTVYHYSLGHLPTRMHSYFGGLGQSGSNEYALLMVQMIPLSIAFFQEGRSKYQKYLSLFSLLVFLYCLTRTHSRAGMIGLMVISGALFYYRLISPKNLLLFIMLFALIFIKTPTAYFERMGTVYEQEAYEEDRNIVSRFESYDRALSILRANPILGTGIGNYHRYVRENIVDTPKGKVFSVHNAYLAAGVESGVFAMGLFIFLVLKTYWYLKKNSLNLIYRELSQVRSLMIAASIATIGYMVIAFTLQAQFNRLFFILMALAVSALRIVRAQVAKQQV